MVAKKKSPYSGKGFIVDSVRGPKKLYDFFWSLTEGIRFDQDPHLNQKMRLNANHFIVHIYHSIKAKMAKKDDDNKYFRNGPDLYVSIFSRLINQKFGKDFKVLSLRNEGLIKMLPANSIKKLTRYYSLPREILETARETENKSISEAWKALSEGHYNKFIPFNIINGLRIRTIEKNLYQPPEQNFKTPTLVKTAMKAISPCVFNPKYVGWWVDYLEKAYLKKKYEFDRLKSTGDTDCEKFDILADALDRLKKKYENERYSQETILYQQPVLTETKSENGDLLYEYRAAYKPQISGRLTEVGGGLQNASRVFKHLAFSGVKNFYNYDLKASQANILIQELNKCGVDSSWITEYINDPKAKNTYAEQIGTDSETWKICLYATFMGANPNMSNSTIQTTLIDYFNNLVLGNKAAIKFRKVTKRLYSTTKIWREKLISPKDSPYIYYSKTFENYRHWINACGMKYKKLGIDRNDN